MDCSLSGSSVHGDSPGENTRMDCLSLLQGIFPTQPLNPELLHCRQILYHLSHKGSPRIPEWVAYPFSRGSCQPRNWTRVFWIAGRFLPAELPVLIYKEAQLLSRDRLMDKILAFKLLFKNFKLLWTWDVKIPPILFEWFSIWIKVKILIQWNGFSIFNKDFSNLKRCDMTALQDVQKTLKTQQKERQNNPIF